MSVMKRGCQAVLVALILTTSATGELTTLAPGDAAIFTAGNLAWLVHAPADGSAPVVVAAFHFGGDVVPVPTPKVTGVMIIENQEDRTAVQARVLDDPIWQTAAIVKGLTYAIEDKDGKQAAPFLAAITIPLPVVCWVGGDGKPVAVVPLPATEGEMRKLIGGVK